MASRKIALPRKNAVSSKTKSSIISKKEKIRIGTKNIVRAPKLSNKQSRILGVPKSSAKFFPSRISKGKK